MITARIDIEALLLAIARSTDPDMSEAFKETAKRWSQAEEADKQKLEAFLLQFVQVHSVPHPVTGKEDMFVGDNIE